MTDHDQEFIGIDVMHDRNVIHVETIIKSKDNTLSPILEQYNNKPITDSNIKGLVTAVVNYVLKSRTPQTPPYP